MMYFFNLFWHSWPSTVVCMCCYYGVLKFKVFYFFDIRALQLISHSLIRPYSCAADMQSAVLPVPWEILACEAGPEMARANH